MGESIGILSNNNPSFTSKLIDSLLDIRLALCIKKITSKFIKKTELKEILDSVKEEAKDLMISNAIDDVFGEYFEEKNFVSNKDEATKASNTEIPEVVNTITSDEDDYEESKREVGISLVKTDGRHKSLWDNESNKAA